MERTEPAKRPGASPWRRLWWAAGVMPLLFLMFFALLGRNHVPDSLMAPPEGIFSESEGETSARRVMARPKRPLWDKPHAPKSMEEYLQFRRAHPADARAVDLYREIEKKMKEEAFSESFTRVFEKSDEKGHNIPWRGDLPLDEETRQWLMENRSLADQFHEMIRAGGPPVISRDEITGWSDLEFFQMPMPDYLMFSRGARILRAEAQRRLEMGDVEEAWGLIDDIYLMGESTRDVFLIGNLFNTGLQQIGNAQIRGWIESGKPLQPETLRQMENSLAGHRFEMADMRFGFEQEYRVSRSFGVGLLSGPVLDMVNTLYRMNRENTFPAPDGNDMQFLRDGWRHPEDAAQSAWRTFMMRTQAAESIREFDAYWKQFLEGVAKPYAESPAAANETPSFADNKNIFGSLIPNLNLALVRVAVNEANVNLNRAGIGILLNNQAPVSDSNAPLPDDHPWRDPFTDSPLKSIDENESRIIYSIGPDLADQLGKIIYDPTNGTYSAGDIAIRLP